MLFNELGACLDVSNGPLLLGLVLALPISAAWGGLYHWLWMYDNEHFHDFRHKFVYRLSSIILAMMVIMIGTAAGGICMAIEYEVVVSFMGWCVAFECVGLGLSIQCERESVGKHKHGKYE